MKILFYCIAVAFILYSCHSSQKNVRSLSEHIQIDFSNETSVEFNTVFDSIKYVILKETDASLFGYITKLKMLNDNIIIYDKRSEKILVYNLEGICTGIIDKQGRGDGEYVSVTDFTVDPQNNQILILDLAQQAIYIFNLQGVFIQSRKIPKNELAVSLHLSTDKLFFTRSNQFKKSEDHPIITMYSNKELSFIGSFYKLPKSLTLLGYHGEFVNTLCTFKDTLYSVSVSDYCISMLDTNGQFISKYEINVDDKYKIKDNTIEKNHKDIKVLPYLYQISDLLIEENYIYFNYNQKYNVIYSPQSHKTVIWNTMNHEGKEPLMSTFLANYGDWMICQMGEKALGFNSENLNLQEGERVLLFLKVKKLL